MPSALPVVSRRRMLFGTAALAVLGVTGAACGGKPAPPPELNDLMTQLERARNDSQLASDAAVGAQPPLQPALTAVSADRAKHAEALSDEIARLTGEATTSSSTTTPIAAPPAAPPGANDVVAALRTSADSAAQLAPQMSGYRAGLLASIAAYCTAAYTVALA
ncbi:hypothetical protein A5662_02560 [Mycobacteriaceae bacterium 1482268.1]|nr:hypothetical protein A5662_02560 [Mycobacteriaceae bacterium 1482268.1]